jgi:hypothetical protein
MTENLAPKLTAEEASRIIAADIRAFPKEDQINLKSIFGGLANCSPWR